MCMNTSKQASNNSKNQAATYQNVDELARELGLGRLTVYAALRDGTIPSIRVGKRYVLPRTAIAEWLRNAGGRPDVHA